MTQPTNTPTPRTDANAYDCHCRFDQGGSYHASQSDRKPDPYGECVSTDFARQLERENTAALARIAELERELERMDKTIDGEH